MHSLTAWPGIRWLADSERGATESQPRTGRKPLRDHPAVLEPPAVPRRRHGDVAVGAPVIEARGCR